MNRRRIVETVHITRVKCCNCGRYIPHEDLQDGSARFEFAPDNHFGPERSEWTCRICLMKERKR